MTYFIKPQNVSLPMLEQKLIEKGWCIKIKAELDQQKSVA